MAAIPRKRWTEAEEWAWQQISAGKVVDFNWLLGNSLNPHLNSHSWDDRRRIIRSGFIEALFIYDYLRDNLPPKFICIEGAKISGDLDLEEIELNTGLSFRYGRIEGTVRLHNSKVPRDLSFQGSHLFRVKGSSLSINGVFNLNYVAIPLTPHR